ncbi:MAG: ethanolamine utilization protein EutN [Ignavibacteriales bacterium]|nr:MAG: ethanolamine utilization protein EutN [Ignavibacteriales bacterium]
MFLAKVKKKIVSSEKHPSYNGRILYIVQPVLPDGKEEGEEWIAMDYVGAGVGDIVVCGGAPGVAKTLFSLELAPIRTLIMAIVEKIDYRDI